jgi:hypothetical protein
MGTRQVIAAGLILTLSAGAIALENARNCPPSRTCYGSLDAGLPQEMVHVPEGNNNNATYISVSAGAGYAGGSGNNNDSIIFSS